MTTTLERQVFDAGIVGAGGAGFPTYKKLVAAELLVINAAECEPLLASDRYLMRHDPASIVAGASAVARACGIPRVVIGTKAHYAREIAALEAAIAAAGADVVSIHGVGSYYPAGDEQSLVYEITGRTVPPGGIPLDLGVVVMNVATTSQVFAAAQAGTPVTRRLVTVTGEVAHPVVVDAPVGTTAADLIAAAGGATVSRGVIVRGGPMMGKHYPLAEAGTLGYGKADGGLIVLDAQHPLVQFVGKPLDRLLAETKSMCIQCRMCTDLCPRYLIGHQMRPHRLMRSLQTGQEDGLTDALLCCECGICELYSCPMGLSPRRMNVYVKGLLAAQGVKVTDKAVHPDQTDGRPYRTIAQSRLIERLQLGAYPTTLDDLVRCEPASVRLPTKHGVGKPARPCVAVGDRVGVGQVVAEVDYGDVGALVHASITGRVSEVDGQHITIEREGGPA